MKFGIILKNDKFAIGLSKKVIKYLQKYNNKVFVKKIPKDIDIGIAIGGDGTVFRALQNLSVPVLGINAGRLGFVTEINSKNLHIYLKRLLNNDYKLEKIRKLKVISNCKILPDSSNDIVIKNISPGKIGEFVCEIDGRKYISYGDGIIICTVLGSTGYSLSLGGPIIDPKLQCVIFSEIACLDLTSRPLILPLNTKITITSKEFQVIIDGLYQTKSAKVTITPSENYAQLIRFVYDFYNKLYMRKCLIGKFVQKP